MGSVDVVRGPSSTYWGSGALGGVVQLFPQSWETMSTSARATQSRATRTLPDRPGLGPEMAGPWAWRIVTPAARRDPGRRGAPLGLYGSTSGTLLRAWETEGQECATSTRWWSSPRRRSDIEKSEHGLPRADHHLSGGEPPVAALRALTPTASGVWTLMGWATRTSSTPDVLQWTTSRGPIWPTSPSSWVPQLAATADLRRDTSSGVDRGRGGVLRPPLASTRRET